MDKKALQRALIRADGNALSAIELLLSGEDRVSRDNVIAANSSGSSGSAAAVGAAAAPVGEVAGSLGDLSAAGSSTYGSGSRVTRVTDNVGANFRRSGSGGNGGGGGGANRSRPRRSRERDVEIGVVTEAYAHTVAGARLHQQQHHALVEREEGVHVIDMDVELGRGAGEWANEAVASGGGTALAAVDPILNGERERRRGRRPATYSSSRARFIREGSATVDPAPPASSSSVETPTGARLASGMSSNSALEPEASVAVGATSPPVSAGRDGGMEGLRSPHVGHSAEDEEAKVPNANEETVSPSPRGASVVTFSREEPSDRGATAPSGGAIRHCTSGADDMPEQQEQQRQQVQESAIYVDDDAEGLVVASLNTPSTNNSVLMVSDEGGEHVAAGTTTEAAAVPSLPRSPVYC